MRKADTRAIVATALYLAAAVLYFSPVALPHKIALGLLILTIFSVRGGNPFFIAAAFFFSFLGDLSGSFKAQSHALIPFFGQMGAFAIGHMFFMLYFLKMRLVRSRWAVTGAATVALAVLASALAVIVPHVEAIPLAAGVGIYAVIISVMMLSAFLTGDKMLSTGAALFVLSDYVLALNMFVINLPYSKYLIMMPYFAAQLLLFLGTRVEKQ